MLYDIFKSIARFFPRIAFMAEYFFYFFVIRFGQLPDVCIISYPKSGRTWLHFLLAKYYSLKFNIPMKKKIYHMANAQIPSLVFSHDGKRVNAFTRNKKLYKKTSVLFLVRDPRDVVVSYYHHNKERDKIYKKDISHFVKDPNYGINTIINFMNQWYVKKDTPQDFLLIRYEDLRSNTPKVAQKILKFLGERKINKKALHQAINEASFSKMKKMEKTGKSKFSGLTEKVKKNNAMKVRKGKVGGYKEEMSHKDRKYVDKMVKENLDPIFRYK